MSQCTTYHSVLSTDDIVPHDYRDLLCPSAPDMAEIEYLSVASTYQTYGPSPTTNANLPASRRPERAVVRSTRTGLNVENDQMVDDEQLWWFLALPPKAMQRLFSRREQVRLAVRCQRALESKATPADILALTQRTVCPYLSPSMADLAGFNAAGKQSIEADYSPADVSQLHSIAVERSTDTYIDCTEEILDLYCDSDALPCEIPKKVPASNSTLQSFPKPLRRPLKRDMLHRALTLVPSVSRARLRVGTRFSSDMMDRGQHSSLVSNLIQSDVTAVGPTFPRQTPTAIYYRDARRQIRDHLSPQKFDEVLKYGFTFANGKDNDSPGRPQHAYEHSRNPARDNRMETPLQDSQGTCMSEAYSSTSASTSHHKFKSKKRYLVHTRPAYTEEREMTIHMTLTRRDLRDM